jgi:uncharacterized protein (DUF58 family)
MHPTLAKRGKLILGSAGMFIAVGAGFAAPPLAGLGGVVVICLAAAYLHFFTTAILLRRRKIELSWWVPPGEQPGGALTVDRPFFLHLALRNHGARTLRVISIRVFGSSGLVLPIGLQAVVSAGYQVEIRGEARARRSGYQVLHGAVLVFSDALGLFDVRAYFPNPIAIKVFPRENALSTSATVRPRGAAIYERVGMHQLRRRGLAGDLREIRDHCHGDPFKYIAWKATAKRGKLMVRDLETEIVASHQLVIDIAGSMRMGSPGRTKLDQSIELASALARSALEGGDRVGLLTFDTRVFSELKPGDGHHHYLKIVDRLMETHSVVDEDLTALTNGELVAALARYLAHQEAVDVRVKRVPATDDPDWEHIQAGPDGELFDLVLLEKVIQRLLRSMGQASAHKSLAPAWWWSRVHIGRDSEKLMGKLRLFARLRGLDLPYQMQHERGRRVRGLEESFRRLASGARPDLVILVSDLVGVLEDPEAARRALARSRRAGPQVVAVVPQGGALEHSPSSRMARAVADVIALDERERVARAQRLLLGHGIPVLAATAEDSPAAIANRIARARRTLRRLA